MDLELEAIIKLCKEQNHGAFEMLYKKYYKILLGIALRYSGSVAEAEDVLQDAFIKIFHSIGAYAGKGSFEGWLKRIVQNTAINNYRSRSKQYLYVEVSEEEYRLEDVSVNTALSALETKEIVTLLNKMPEGYRIAINLYIVDGYSHEEIAGMLNISVGTSKSQLFRARKYLKRLIELNNQEKII